MRCSISQMSWPQRSPGSSSTSCSCRTRFREAPMPILPCYAAFIVFGLSLTRYPDPAIRTTGLETAEYRSAPMAAAHLPSMHGMCMVMARASRLGMLPYMPDVSQKAAFPAASPYRHLLIM